MIAGVTVQGKSVSIPTGNAALSAIDTGTTLIGGPSDAVNAIYGAIDGAQPLGGSMQGFWAFREFFFGAISSRLWLFILILPAFLVLRSMRHEGANIHGVWRQAVAYQ